VSRAVRKREREIMKKLIFSFIALLILSASAYAQTTSIQDTVQNRLAEADRYLTVMPPKEMLIDMVRKMSVQLPEEQQKPFIRLMTKHLDLEKLTYIIKDGLVRHFTAAELNALANFYGSSLGKSAMTKFGQYMADAAPHIQVLMEEAFKKAKAEMEAK
jgi:hypothetical protein